MTSSQESIKPILNAELLERYLAGACASNERTQVELWLDAEAGRRARLALMQERLGTVAADTLAPEVVDKLWHQFVDRRMNRGEQSPALSENVSPSRQPGTHFFGSSRRQPSLGTQRTRALRRNALYVMVSVIIGALGVVAGWHSGTRHFTEATVRPVSTYTTTNGQRANITLLDGTTVALNVASRLDVPADFASGNHTVHLTGEALITVSHHAGTPFTVVAGTTAVRVLGTTFAVRRYTTDTAVTVAVRDGRVAVGSSVLGARQAIEVGLHGVSPVQEVSASSFSFATGTLSLPHMSLPEAIPALDRWFDADIRLGDRALATRYIKGDFDAGSLSDLANMLAVAFEVRVVQDGRVLTLYPRSQQ